MRIVFLVRMLVMMAVVPSPPKRTFLQCRAADPGEDKLEQPASLVSPVCEIPMVNPRDAKHTDHVEQHGQPDRRPCNRHEKWCYEGGNVQQYERNGTNSLAPSYARAGKL